MDDIAASIVSVQRGAVRPFRAPDEPSAIAKASVEGKVAVGPLGLAGDEQADLVNHGGPDKAIHHYPHDHYAYWRSVLGDHPLLAAYGAFGENISTRGLIEEEACIGDRFRLGTALVEISQGRQPCWKLDHRFGVKGVMAGVVASRRSGWYYRVIEEGAVAAGDTLALIDRPFPQWSVARVFGLLVAGGHKADRAGLEALGAVSVLAAPWAKRRAALLA